MVVVVFLLFVVDTVNVNYSKIIREFQLENERCATWTWAWAHTFTITILNNNNQNQATLECKVYCLRPWNCILLYADCVCVCMYVRRAANNFVHIYNGWYVGCVAAMHGMMFSVHFTVNIQSFVCCRRLQGFNCSLNIYNFVLLFARTRNNYCNATFKHFSWHPIMYLHTYLVDTNELQSNV